MKDIRIRAVSGSVWVAVSRSASLAIKFFGGILIARMIAPQHFGQIGFACSIFALVFALSSWGNVTAILRHNVNIEKYIGTLLTIRIVMVLFLSLITAILAYPIYLKYGAITAIILLAITLSYIPSYIADIHRASIEKELLFNRVAFIEFAVALCSTAVGCILALRGYKTLALLAMLVLANVLTGLFSFMLAPKQIKPCFDKESAVDFFHYGKHCLLQQNLNTVYDNAGGFCIGAFIGNLTLGLYQRAYMFSYLFTRIVWGGPQIVMGSVFGRLRDDKRRLGLSYEILNSFVFRISLLFCLWLGITIPDFIYIVYGKEWLPAALLFRLFIPFALISGVREINFSLQLTAGHSSTVTKAQYFETGSFLVLLIPMFILLKEKGAIIAIDFGAIVGILLLLRYSSKLVDLRFKKVFLSPMLYSAATLIVVIVSFRMLRINNILIRFVFQSVYIISVYFIMMFVFERSYVKSILHSIFWRNKR